MTAELPSGSGRRIPGRSAGLLGDLARDRPRVLTLDDLSAYLAGEASPRDPARTARQLQRLGWLTPTPLNGAWAFVPPGEDEVVDRYLGLRAWRAREPEALFALAGEAAAWHLGYLDREFDGPVAVWIPRDTRLPFGLRSVVSEVTLGWHSEDAPRLGPSPQMLQRRRLDLTGWADGLPAFGPEALLVQVSARGASFRSWADLVPHLDQLASDCSLNRLIPLLAGRSASTWQRAAYLLDRGDQAEDAGALLAERPSGPLVKVQLGAGPRQSWAPRFQIVDHVVAPLQAQLVR
ncbi:MAG TPA: type IV toxin-antitoxin system AbiEi family antitoxin [Candidatus Dormibacteraeota bacterium]|jgi:hypothetical protein|nr:type IV toxin-antitoxin system AbiEi family antitoxin [Candidatus Dormibacteraeota bacterium]